MVCNSRQKQTFTEYACGHCFTLSKKEVDAFQLLSNVWGHGRYHEIQELDAPPDASIFVNCCARRYLRHDADLKEEERIKPTSLLGEIKCSPDPVHVKHAANPCLSLIMSAWKRPQVLYLSLCQHWQSGGGGEREPLYGSHLWWYGGFSPWNVPISFTVQRILRSRLKTLRGFSAG